MSIFLRCLFMATRCKNTEYCCCARCLASLAVNLSIPLCCKFPIATAWHHLSPTQHRAPQTLVNNIFFYFLKISFHAIQLTESHSQSSSQFSYKRWRNMLWFIYLQVLFAQIYHSSNLEYFIFLNFEWQRGWRPCYLLWFQRKCFI